MTGVQTCALPIYNVPEWLKCCHMQANKQNCVVMVFHQMEGQGLRIPTSQLSRDPSPEHWMETPCYRVKHTSTWVSSSQRKGLRICMSATYWLKSCFGRMRSTALFATPAHTAEGGFYHPPPSTLSREAFMAWRQTRTQVHMGGIHPVLNDMK